MVKRKSRVSQRGRKSRSNRRISRSSKSNRRTMYRKKTNRLNNKRRKMSKRKKNKRGGGDGFKAWKGAPKVSSIAQGPGYRELSRFSQEVDSYDKISGRGEYSEKVEGVYGSLGKGASSSSSSNPEVSQRVNLPGSLSIKKANEVLRLPPGFR